MVNEARDRKDVYSWAIYYLRNGLNVIPLRYKDKKPILQWDKYQEQRVTQKEIENWFKDKNVNIGIICGAVSGNLMVLDFDSEEVFYNFLMKLDDDLLNAIRNTWIIKTGKGIHVYFRTPNPIKTRRFRDLGIDIQGEGSYVVAPPSIHPNGSIYEFKRLADSIYILSEGQLNKLLNILEEMRKKPSKEDKQKEPAKQLRELTDDQIEKVINLFLPYWVEGRRHILSLAIAGALYWNGYSLESAKRLIERLCDRAKDEEKDDRIRVVEDTYKKAKELESKGESILIAYKTWFKSSGIPEDKLDELVYKFITTIKGKFVFGFGQFTVLESDNSMIVCDFKNCLIRRVWWYNIGNNQIKRWESIATCVPVDIEVIHNEDIEQYKIQFKTQEGQTFSVEGDISEISSMLKKTARVTKRQKFEDALSLIISRAVAIGCCRIVRGERVKGILLINNQPTTFDFDINYTIDELKEALQLLNDFVKLSEFNKERVAKISKIIKWFVVSGFNYVYKQLGHWIPHLYIYGESDTGKTATARFLQNIWHDTSMYSLGSIDSPYRLGILLSNTTFPIVINEMDFDSLSDEVVELWKNAVDGIIIRTRYGKKVKAYGILCFTSNTSIPSNRAIQKRLEIIHFDPQDSIKLIEQKDEFEKLNAKREKLKAIGKFAFNFIKDNIEMLKTYDWEALGEIILREAYRTAGLEVPYWIDYEYKEESDVRVSKSEEIRAIIFDALAKSVPLLNCETADDVYGVFKDAAMKISWIAIRKDNEVVLLSPLIRLLNKHGVKISSLKDLTLYIPKSQYNTHIKIKNRVTSGVIINMLDFAEWLGIYSSKMEDDEPLDHIDRTIILISKLLDELGDSDLGGRLERLRSKGLISEKAVRLIKMLNKKDVIDEEYSDWLS